MSNKAQAKSMKQDGKRELKPKLRFPEFRDEWIEKPLKEFATIITEKAGEKKCTLLSVTSGVGLISQMEKFGRNIAGDQYKNYLILRKNDFAYNKSATKAYPQGFIAKYSGDELAAVPNSIFTCFSVQADRVNPEFLNYQFLGNIHGKWVKKYIEVSARAHGSLSINDDDLLALPIPIPRGKSSLAEQQKIAECLTSLDELIGAHGQKLDALKVHKKGLMEQLFPRAGETLPRLRFPKFQDAPEWENLPIGDKVDLFSGYPFDGAEISENRSGKKLLRGINITEGVIRHSPSIDRYYSGVEEGLEKYEVRTNDLVIGMDGSKVGKNSALITVVDSGALLVQRVARLRADNPTLINFIFQQINSPIFHSYVDRINTSSGIPHISAKQIKDFCICFPSELEQKKVVGCLTFLDGLIAAQTEKLAVLKAQKQGLMQQLFSSAQEVET